MATQLNEVDVARLLIVDDNPTMREAITLIIEHENDLSICGEAANVADAIAQCERLSPHMALVDLSLKNENGLSVVRRLKDIAPDIKAVVFSLHDESEYINRARDAGAGGYAIKSGGPQAMLSCIRSVLDGKTCFAAPDPL